MYAVDRRNTAPNPYIYVSDTMGTQIRQILYPVVAATGPRGLAIDRNTGNPYGKSLINMYSWFDASGVLDSCSVFELDTANGSILNRFGFGAANVTWNCRGIEYDPRDGSYWVGIMDNANPPPSPNSVFKVYGFHTGAQAGIVDQQTVMPKMEVVWVRARPDPFTGSTVISYSLPVAQKADVRIFDAAGREVRKLFSGNSPAGEFSVNWTGLDNRGNKVTPGVYILRCQTPNDLAKTKLVFLR